jgi:hypothetical protein
VNETDYRRLDLPIAAVDQRVRDVIAGGGPLSAEILRQWSVAAIWTAAAPGTTAQDLVDVARGRLSAPARLNPTVIAFIRQFLAGGSERFAFFEDAVSRPGDAVLARARSPYVVINDHVFPILRDGHVQDGAVADLLTDAWSWRLVGLLTTADNDALGTSLADLVARSRHVVVGAWDGEGLLVVDRA